MIKHGNIVVPTDFSACSDEALRRAYKLADLLVLGRHGQRGKAEQLLIGSTSERVVRHAPCSVLVTMPHGILE